MNNIGFYDKHGQRYAEDTRILDMGLHYEVFQSYLSKGDHILDLGCGSGRDTKYFLEAGYQVTSMDGSMEMVKQSSEFLSRPVIHATFEAFNTDILFDGIWASASLLHVEKHKLPRILEKYIKMLHTNGVFFMSFKAYEHDFEYDGRTFTCFTKSSLEKLLKTFNDVTLMNIRITKSVQNSNMEWVSAVVKKI